MSPISSTDGKSFTATNPDNHQPWLWFTHIFGITMVSLAAGMRIHMKKRNPNVDDAILLVAHLVYIAYWIVVLFGLVNSLGKSDAITSQAEVARASKFVFASRILLILILVLTKISIAFLVQGIFTKEIKLWLREISVAVIVVGFAECLSISVGCAAGRLLLSGEDAACSNNNSRWIFVTVSEVLLEAILVVPVVPAVIPLHTNMKTKFWVVSVFFFRLIIWIPAILHMVLYTDFTRDGKNNIDLVPTMVMETLWAALALVTTSSPILMRVAKKFTTQGPKLTTVGASRNALTAGSYKLKSNGTGRRTPEQMVLRPDQGEYASAISSGKPRSVTSSSESQVGILRDVYFEVTSSTGPKQ